MGFYRRPFARMLSRPATPARQAVRRGDAARARRDWPVAADAYRSAVELDPDLAHIWAQLGHTQKEQGELIEAISAFQERDGTGKGDGAPHPR